MTTTRNASPQISHAADPDDGVASDLMSPAELVEEALIPHVSVDTLAYWRTRKIGPKWYKLGSRVYYRRSEVLAWIEAQAHGGGDAA